MHCVNCGKKIEKKESKFCKYCGSPILNADNGTFTSENNNDNSNKDTDEINNDNKNDNEYNTSDTSNETFTSKNNNDNSNKAIDNTIDADSLDKWLGIKGKFDKVDLSEKRFKIAYQILYFFSVWNILLGLYLNDSSSDFSSALSGNEVLWGGVIYIVLTFAFHMLKMPIMLGVLALGMFADKLYTMVLMHKISGLAIIVSIIILLGAIQSFRSKSNLQTKNNKVLKVIVSVVLFIVISLGVAVSVNPYIFEDKEWDEQKTAYLKDVIFKSYNFYDEKSKLKDFNDGETFFVSLAEKTAQCSVNKIKEEFPNYAKFLSELDSKNDNQTKQKLKEIKQKCFAENYEKLQKEKNKWPTYAYFNIADGIKNKYMKLYKENYGPFDEELTKKYDDMALNIGKCVAEGLKNKFPKFKEFEIKYLSNEKTNDVKKEAQNIETECREKYSRYIAPKKWSQKTINEFKTAIQSSVLESLNKSGEFSQKQSKTLASNTSVCFIKTLKSEYPNYAEFDKDFFVNKSKKISQRISEIKVDCLKQSTKKYVKDTEGIWTEYYINDLTNIFAKQYYEYINTAKNSNTLTEKEKKEISENTAKCIVDKITTTYPHFTNFMKSFTDKKSDVSNKVDKFRNDCFVKHMLGIE